MVQFDTELCGESLSQEAPQGERLSLRTLFGQSLSLGCESLQVTLRVVTLSVKTLFDF